MMARLLTNRSAAYIPSHQAEYREIIDWYRNALANEPARDWNTNPVTIGPTWKHDGDGWVLPDLTLGWNFVAWSGRWLRNAMEVDARTGAFLAVVLQSGRTWRARPR